MIVCPNCSHQNPDGAVQCEACYTPLPAMMSCPSCGTSVQSDASFCGQCGFNLKSVHTPEAPVLSETSAETSTTAPELDLPDLIAADPLIEPEPLPVNIPEAEAEAEAKSTAVSPPPPPSPLPPPEPTAPQMASPPPAAPSAPNSTQLQIQTASLLHIQTNAMIELPHHLTLIHIGKSNDRIPPDIDVSGFPDSEIVSRVHADIRVEGDAFYIEDTGSSNGTYVNNLPLPLGNRHRLRTGDRIALGKGDKVSFLFQIT
ncbi:MAG: FHA domain-containing protein [Elainellaceae cyanobacterium]